ncbi:TlyA family RNA methyltransferase [Serinibacter salmoneus]|uniref:23S rRNA (Cytidine1920-2'-O)/16S rRNA (Cytidine1409-2'-O)-methyltransferase n=1 Tax=Serinibacter salmoneus TaxID=556530 RepID=A0A2A9CYD4_9MICO|nr:TlyA family RNA methyltransferase [Serinibacter salmoneus]PFG19448.1 23S rRNA (cytidine1920-2'-O)/16S rRNA (cytidine1409-2'-O)-methyltransferase [Serinibacter salmoneus]
MARLDAALVQRGLATSRTRAQRLIAQSRVLVNDAVVTRAATPVQDGDAVTVAGEEDYVSRSAHKLLGALDTFGALPDAPRVAGVRALDAGASTGGFTQVLLERGAEQVVAVDVGTDQLHPALRADPRVAVMEHTNVRTLTPGDIGGQVELLVADLSFISLRLVLDAFAACLRPGGHAVVLVKPQFEVGRERLGAGGIVTDAGARTDAVIGVLRAAHTGGWRVRAVAPSILPGTHGNREYLAWWQAPAAQDATLEPEDRVEEMLRDLARRGTNGELAVAEWETW